MEGLIDGRWRVGAPIASGPWGDVLGAHDEADGGEAGLLLLARGADGEPGAAALGDPALLAGLEHPHVARVRAWGCVAQGPRELLGRAYLALDPLEGQTLRALARGAGSSGGPPLEPERLGRVALDVLGALEAAHALGVRHRRLGPDHVLVGPDGATVLGLGLPPAQADQDAHVAPEVLRGADGDARADLYSLGACLYEAATGRPPDRLVFVPARDLRPDLPAALEQAIAALLEDDPRARPASAAAARALFAAALGLPDAGGAGDHPAGSSRRALAEPRFVGREEALEAVAAAVDEAQALAAAGRAAREAAPAGPPTFVVVRAPHGFGRTRLLAEAGAAQARRGVRVLQAQGFGGGDPFAPWRAVLDGARRLAEPEVQQALVRAQEALEGGTAGDALARWERVARALLELAERRPLLVLFDDAHLLGEPAAALLLHVARAAHAPGAGGALALVASVPEREGDASPLARALGAPLAPAHRSLALAELPAEDALALARSLVPDEPAAARLAELSGGDPSLLVELARAHRQGGGTPASVNKAVRARLAQASPRARALLDALAVVGRPMPLAALAELAPPARSSGSADPAPADASELLRGLLSDGLVRRQDAGGREPTYDLRDGLTRLLLRQALGDAAEGAARDACARALAALERAGGLRPGERARLMLQARLDGAADAALAAAPDDAAPEELYRGAVELLPAGARRAGVRRELAERLRARGAFAEARAALQAALADLGPASRETALDHAQAHLALAEVAMAEGKTRDALERSTRGARLLDEHGLSGAGAATVLAKLLSVEARAVTQHSDHAGAARLLARAKATLERDQEPALYARLEIEEANAWVLSLDRTRYDAARARLEALLERLSASKDEAGAVAALRSLGNLAYYSGDHDQAEARFREALARCERLGDLPLASGLWNNLGLVARMKGAHRRAELALERALDIAERLGQGSVICRALTNVGRVRRALGDLRGAGRSLRRAAEVAHAVGDVMIESAALSELGLTLQAEGRKRAGLAILLRSRRLRRTLGDPGRVAESELELAELWRAAGDVRAALASTARGLALQASLGDGDGAAAAVEALEFATGRPGGPAALLETARRGPRPSGPPPLPDAVKRGAALARLARRALAAAMSARAGDPQQARVHALHAKRLLRRVKAQDPAPAVLALARALAFEARAVVLAARGRPGDARELLDRALADPALPPVRRGALRLKRAFLDLALGDLASARADAARAGDAGLSGPLAERRAVGRALVAAALALRAPDLELEWPGDAPAPELPEAQEVARRLGDVALLALVSTALAEALAAEQRGEDAATERAAAGVAAARLALGLPASLRAGIERAHAPAAPPRAVGPRQAERRPPPPARPARAVVGGAGAPLDRVIDQDDDGDEVSDERPVVPARPARRGGDDDEDSDERLDRSGHGGTRARPRPSVPDEVPIAVVDPAIIGESLPMRAVHRLIERYGRTTAPVTIHGESGTGKELVARALHRASPRRDGPFVAFNCSAVADTLLESELFGALKGAYTGSERDRKGLFELAHGGTLFMDEVGDMSLDMQAKLLRVLETGELRPVGGRQVVKVEVRIISASHHDLRALSQQGKMREDLFYRLNVLRIELPPLRERREDLPALVEHFLRRVAQDRGEEPKRLSAEALEVLLRHPFPGNVRELRNVIERACVLEPGDVIGGSRLLVDGPPPPSVRRGAGGPPGRADDAARLPAYQRTYAYQGVALNRRQRQVLDYLAEGAVAITNREFCSMVGVSERTGLRDLTELVDQGILTRLGKRKGARYQLAQPVG